MNFNGHELKEITKPQISRMWINLCSDCKKGFKSKIKETR